jgi:hypothetical protein
MVASAAGLLNRDTQTLRYQKVREIEERIGIQSPWPFKYNISLLISSGQDIYLIDTLDLDLNCALLFLSIQSDGLTATLLIRQS